MRSSIGRELRRLRAAVTCEGNCQGAESLELRSTEMRPAGETAGKRIKKLSRISETARDIGSAVSSQPTVGGRVCPL